MEQQYNFYNNLYKSDNISKNKIIDYLNNTNNLKTLSEQEKILLEGEIDEIKCKEAIEKMKINKSPGSDVYQ